MASYHHFFHLVYLAAVGIMSAGAHLLSSPETGVPHASEELAQSSFLAYSRGYSLVVLPAVHVKQHSRNPRLIYNTALLQKRISCIEVKYDISQRHILEHKPIHETCPKRKSSVVLSQYEKSCTLPEVSILIPVLKNSTRTQHVPPFSQPKNTSSLPDEHLLSLFILLRHP